VRKTALLLALVGAAAIAVAAPTYRWVDADGVHYSDQPHPGAEIITLGTTQTFSSEPAVAAAASANRKPANPRGTSEFRYDSCAIVQPAADQVLLDVEAVTVAVVVQPAKRSRDKVVLAFDGAEMQPASPDQSEFRISPIDRGTHQVAAIVRDASGRDLCQSPLVIFHVRQPSALGILKKH
jgi:hypothetical protein